MPIVFIGLGSNMGDRYLNIQKAADSISKKCKVTAVSRVYETNPMYVIDQPKFLNAVIKVSTGMDPNKLLNFLNKIENELGRNRAKERRFGARTIDLDILFFDNVKLKSDKLVIPHPRLHERAFVLIPLYEIKKNTKIRTMINNLPKKELEGVKPFSTNEWHN
jgi:2-amino-4-hydroxy-6-hydroxymethyldihydropteridine diphosphokinase